MKKFLLVFSLLFLLVSCRNKYSNRTILINDNLYVKKIETFTFDVYKYQEKPKVISYRVYYVGPLTEMIYFSP